MSNSASGRTQLGPGKVFHIIAIVTAMVGSVGCGGLQTLDVQVLDSGQGDSATSISTSDVLKAGIDGGVSGMDADDTEPEFWTIAVLPDTQGSYYYSPPFFESETRWIAANYQAERIAFVLHEGDIVDTPLDTDQWAIARASMGLLDGKLPYVLAVGNHDLGLSATPSNLRSTLINDVFTYSDLSNRPGFGGAYQTGHLENTYYLLPAGGQTWLVLSLEFSPRPEVLAWAGQILSANAALPAIVLTHAYLYSDGNRYNLNGRVCQFSGDCTTLTPVGSNPQCWNPVCYLGDGSDGETMWNSLILPHSNVVFVFSGHVANAAPLDAARLSSVRPDGTVCHQLMADYQADTTGGDGYFRLVRIWRDGRVQVRTFSPYVDAANAYLTDDQNQFDLQI
jgi:hypothetical protein